MKSRNKSIKQNLNLQQPIPKPHKKSETKKQHKNQLKSKNINQSFVKPFKSSSNKQADDVKKYLQKSLSLMVEKFGSKSIEGINQSIGILNLSISLYKIIKQNISNEKRPSTILLDEKLKIDANINSNKHNQPQKKDQLKNNQNKLILDKHNDSRRVIMSYDIQPERQRANSAMANYSELQGFSICPQQHGSIISSQLNGASADNSVSIKRRSNSTLDTYFREKFGSNFQDEQAVQKKLRVIKALKKSQQIVTKSHRTHLQSSMMLTNCDINEKSIVMDKLKSKHYEKIR